MGFIRSFLFLKNMNLYELGTVSIFQTIILFFGLSQIGILNGAYRAFSGTKKYYRSTINDFTFSFFLILSFLTALALLVTFAISDVGHALILAGAAIAGVLSLMVNHLNNILLADSKIKEVNIINIVSNLLGYSSLILIVYHPLYGLISFIIHPLSFVVLTFIFDRAAIPRRFFVSKSMLRLLLRLGFIPYLTALFLYLNLQVERWAVVFSLGVETFGRLYLAIAFTSLFALFPNSVNSLYFPRMVRAYAENSIAEFNRLFKQYSYILSAYCAAAILATALLAHFVVGLFFPQHLENIVYVYYMLPGLVLITIANPYIIYFNASLNMRPLLLGYGLSTAFMIFCMTTLYFTNTITLKSIAITDSLANSVIFLLMLYLYFKHVRSGGVPDKTRLPI